MLLAALWVMYGRTLLRDLMWKKQDLTTAETCCSMESSASKVTPSVFTMLENGIDASPTEVVISNVTMFSLIQWLLETFSWFAVHCTSMNNTNGLISGDNKGYASLTC